MDEVRNLAELDVENCPRWEIPEWLRDYRNAIDDLSTRLRAGDFEEAGVTELLALRSQLVQRQREMNEAGRRYGYHAKTAGWFVKYE